MRRGHMVTIPNATKSGLRFYFSTRLANQGSGQNPQRQPKHHFMACPMSAVELRRVDISCNMRRFYRLDMQPDLFDGFQAKADKKAALLALGAGRIEHPEGALS